MAKKKQYRRPSRVVYVSFSNPDLANRLIEDADRDDRSISNQIVRIIREHYESKDGQQTR